MRPGRRVPVPSSPPTPTPRVRAVPLAPAPPSRGIPLPLQVAGLLGVAILCVFVGGFLLPGPPPIRLDPTPPPSANVPRAVVAGETAAPTPTAVAAPQPETPPVAVRRPDELPTVPPAAPSGFASRIDREIDAALAAARLSASPISSDAEFLRRVYLDLTGRIPSRDRTVAFLDSADPLKRSKLIDELLASPEYGRHFAHLWTDVLVKRDFDTNKNLSTDAFVAWLANRFNQNDGWDRIVTDLVTAEGKEAEHPETFFVVANQDNNQPSPSKLVGTTANLFLGVPLQCAECHQHPYVKEWGIKDFWGVAAFFGKTKIERDGPMKGNKATGPATITEAVARPAVRGPMAKGKAVGKATPPAATIAVPDPTDPKKTIDVVPAKFFEGDKPSLSPSAAYRPALASWLTSSGNRYFATAAVNRLWAHLFARGLVNPIEDMTPTNKASHPELLAALADEFRSSGYDLKHLLRTICNSRAYQRSSRPLPGNREDDELFSKQAVKVMGPRELLDSLAVATGRTRERDSGSGKRNNAPASGVRFFDTREVDDDPTEYSYGIPQVLRMMNTNLTNSSSDVASRLAKTANGDHGKVIEEIYLTALSRRPRADELQKMTAYVQRQSDPVKGYAGVFWALLNSAEFVSNH